APEEGRRERHAHARALHGNVPHHAELDQRDDRYLRVGDLRQRLPDGRGAHHSAPAGAERRTRVISARSSPSSAGCCPRVTGSAAGSGNGSFASTRRTTSGRSSPSRTPSAYGQSSSTASWSFTLPFGFDSSRSIQSSAWSRW